VIRTLVALAALALLGACATAPGSPATPAYTDISQAFVDFYDRTQGLDEAARLAAFEAEIAPLFPGFYAPRNGQTQEQRDRTILGSLRRFPEIRAKYVEVQRSFPAAYAGAIAHFRRFFPHSTATLPTFFLHSLGEMDGGTREIDGRPVMVFGADGIAQYHSPADIGPFFDHELFHVENSATFPECEPVWCALWMEGLATAAAEVMNPGIDPAGLMLTTPRPLAPEVDADWRGALCLMQASLGSTERKVYAGMFMGGSDAGKYPPRWGYYVGYRLGKRLLRSHSLAQLAHLTPSEAEPVLRAELATMTSEAGGCPES
jgi:hypothetical protein